MPHMEENLNISVTKGVVSIQDSWKISKKDFDRILDRIQRYIPNRTKKSLRREWAAHNLLHSLKVQRSRTAHVDFNYPQNWKEKIGYGILGRISLLFIR